MDLTRLSDAQLMALRSSGGDMTKLSDDDLTGIQSALSPSTGRRAMETVNTGVNWLGTQLTKGVTGVLGAPSALGELGRQGAGYLGEKVGVPEAGRAAGAVFKNMMTFGGVTPSTEAMNRAVFAPPGRNLSDLVTGAAQPRPEPFMGINFGVPEVNAADNPNLMLKNPLGLGRDINAGAILDAGVQAIPGMMMLPGAAQVAGGARAASVTVPAVSGGMTSELAGQYAKDTPYEIPARLAGGLAGAMVGGRVVTPLRANLTPEQARNVATARELGIPMTVGQETGRMRGVESALSRFPTSGYLMRDAADRQRQAINTAALARTGTQGNRVDPGTIDDAFTRLGGDFDQLVQGQNVQLRPDFFNRVGRSTAEYAQNTLPSDISPAVTRRLNDFWNMRPAQGQAFPELTSQQYQEFRRSVSKAAADATDPSVRGVLRDMRGALDNAMEQSLPADRAAAWRTAREHWGNLKTLATASAAGTQESRAAGNLSPGALTSAVRRSRGTDQFARGNAPMDDISRAGDYLADSIPNSGTPQTAMMQTMLTGGPLAVAFGTGGIPAAAAVAAGMAVPNVLARAMAGTRGTGWLRDYLANQTMTNAYPQVGYRGLVDALARGSSTAVPRLENRP
tara:strand:+ start:403 stop:2271 length:1869 start_codon:yes stop_codon:yes gene_type:complete